MFIVFLLLLLLLCPLLMSFHARHLISTITAILLLPGAQARAYGSSRPPPPPPAAPAAAAAAAPTAATPKSALSPLFYRPAVWSTPNANAKTGQLPGETAADALKRLNIYDGAAFFLCTNGDTCVPLPG